MNEGEGRATKPPGLVIQFPGGELARARFAGLPTVELLRLGLDTFALGACPAARARHFTELYPLLKCARAFKIAAEKARRFEGGDTQSALLSLRFEFLSALSIATEGELNAFVEGPLRAVLIRSLAAARARRVAR